MALPPRVPLTKDVDVVAWMRGEGLQADLIERVKGSLSGEVLLSAHDLDSLGKRLREVMGIAPMDAFAIASKVYPSTVLPAQPSENDEVKQLKARNKELENLLAAAVSPPLPINNDPDILLENALSELSLQSLWKAGQPPEFTVESDTKKWFTTHVREDLLNKLGFAANAKWPSAREVVMEINNSPGVAILHAVVRQCQPIAKPADAEPPWQAELAKLANPNYAPASGIEWEYLRTLGRSSLLDVGCYSSLRDKYPLAKKRLPEVDAGYRSILDRNQNTWLSAIPSMWQDHARTVEYQRNFDSYSTLWGTIRPEKTELELTGGPLSDIFDRFFRYVPRFTLFAGSKYGAKFQKVETYFTRGTQDSVKVEGLISAPDVLPDGRFVVSVEGEEEFSLVYIEDKKKTAIKDEDAVMYSDRKTVLLETQRSLLAVIQDWKLSPQDAEQVCLPAIHTQWPKIWVFGVSYARDGSCVTRLLAEYDGMDTAQRASLREMCLRVLLLLKQTLDAVNIAQPYPGQLRIPQLTKNAKHANSKSPTSDGTPGESPAKTPPAEPTRPDRSIPMRGLQWRSESVCVETVRCVWKAATRNGKEGEILQLLGGRKHFPPLLDFHASAAPMVGAFALPYLPDRAVASLDEARLLTADLAEALEYLHSVGYMHRDVKRANVRFTGTEAFLIDLDSAVPWSVERGPLRGIAGTLDWRAPEARAEDSSYTNKIDLYGLGLVLFDELLCLYFPKFWRVGEDTLDTTPRGICSLLSKVAPDDALTLVSALVSLNPEHRPTAAGVLRSRFLEGTKASSAAPEVVQRQRDLMRTCQRSKPPQPQDENFGASPLAKPRIVDPRAILGRVNVI